MDSKTISFLSHELLILMTFLGLLKDSLAMRSLHFTSQPNRHVVDLGGCPQMRVDSEAACAIQCYLHTWCRVYVVGSCDQGLPNPCPCTFCQMDPVINEFLVGYETVGTLSTPIRLVDTNTCGFGLQWATVQSSCVNTVGSITSTLPAIPILALEFTTMSAVIGRTNYFASPVCPPTFTPRGEVECSSTDGIWQNQDTLACFSTECYQLHNGKEYYAGTKNVTQNGRPCWFWEFDGPFSNNMIGHPFTFDDNDRRKAKNYCRVFVTEDYDDVWCYNANYDVVSDPLRYENCDIPECMKVY